MTEYLSLDLSRLDIVFKCMIALTCSLIMSTSRSAAQTTNITANNATISNTLQYGVGSTQSNSGNFSLFSPLNFNTVIDGTGFPCMLNTAGCTTSAGLAENYVSLVPGQNLIHPLTADCETNGDCVIDWYVMDNGGEAMLNEEHNFFSVKQGESMSDTTFHCFNAHGLSCTSGATNVNFYPGNQLGVGRLILAGQVDNGTISSGSWPASDPWPSAIYVGVRYPNLGNSNMVLTSANSQQGQQTVQIQTSTSYPWQQTSASALMTGWACVADNVAAQKFPYFEIAYITVNSATTISANFMFAHNAGAAISQGGGCGSGIEQTANTAVQSIKQLFPILGTYNSRTFYAAPADSAILAVPHTTYWNATNNSANLSVIGQVASVSEQQDGSANVVTRNGYITWNTVDAYAEPHGLGGGSHGFDIEAGGVLLGGVGSTGLSVSFGAPTFSNLNVASHLVDLQSGTAVPGLPHPDTAIKFGGNTDSFVHMYSNPYATMFQLDGCSSSCYSGYFNQNNGAYSGYYSVTSGTGSWIWGMSGNQLVSIDNTGNVSLRSLALGAYNGVAGTPLAQAPNAPSGTCSVKQWLLSDDGQLSSCPSAGALWKHVVAQ